MADAMQAAGFALFKQSELRIEGDRVTELIRALGLPSGDEAMAVAIEPGRDGVAASLVRVRTLRKGMKEGVAKRNWSEAVLDVAACLLETIPEEDPAGRPIAPGATPPAIPTGVRVEVRLRRFLETSKVKSGKVVWLQTVADVKVDGVVVLPAGAPVVARAYLTRDIGEFGKAAKGGIRFECAIAPNGAKVPLRGEVTLDGSKRNTAAVTALAVGVSAGFAGMTGSGFAAPAGALMQAEIGAAAESSR
jgi:hypothetical protein